MAFVTQIPGCPLGLAGVRHKLVMLDGREQHLAFSTAHILVSVTWVESCMEDEGMDEPRRHLVA